MPLSVEILTPNRLLLQDEVDELNLPGTEGYLGILPGHIAFLTNLERASSCFARTVSSVT